MRNEKTFFKWSFGLRFLFVFSCALMCVGNAWGAKGGARIAVEAPTNGYVVANKSQPNKSSDYKNTQVLGGVSRGSSGGVYIDYWVGALAVHTKKFVRWNDLTNPSGGASSVEEYVHNVQFNTGGTPALYNFYQIHYRILTHSTDSQNYQYTASAVFDAAQKANVKIQKESGRGTVDVNVVFFEWASTKIATTPINCPTVSAASNDTTFHNLTKVVDETEYPYELYEGDCVVLKANPNDGIVFNGWYKIVDEERILITTEERLVDVVPGDITYYADFSEPEDPLHIQPTDKFLVGTSACQTLEQAIAAAIDKNESVIRQLGDYTVPAGNYTIPAGVTLLIPFEEDQTTTYSSVHRVTDTTLPESAYCTLTLSSGVHMEVYGSIEVSGEMSTSNVDNTGDQGISCTSGPSYGRMIMEEGSSITLNNGAHLYAWGFVTGAGTIDVRRGAIVRELFQIYDWKGFAATAFMAMESSVNYSAGLRVLPINQYFIQNVEVPTKYRPGSKLFSQLGVYLFSQAIAFNDIGVIGAKYEAGSGIDDDKSIFLMDDTDDSDDTWVLKYYDAENDKQVYEINNSAYLGGLSITVDLNEFGEAFVDGVEMVIGHRVEKIEADSKDFALPITNNFKIHLLSGQMIMLQNTELLPGSEIEINKKSTMTINPGQTLSLYDSEQWGTYVSSKTNDFGYATEVRYLPSGGDNGEGGKPNRRTLTPAGLGDAKLTVHGTIDVKGYLKTTIGDKSATYVNTMEGEETEKTWKLKTTVNDPEEGGGASITSTIEDAGTIKFTQAIPSETSETDKVSDYIWQVNQLVSSNPSYVGDRYVSALLKNEGEDNYTHTGGTGANKSFCYIDFNGVGTWKALQNDGCFVYEVVNDETIYYAKPKEYVALASNVEDENTHLYYSADGTRMFIVMQDCQLWEVEAVPNHPELFHCIHPLNNTYYYWDDDSWAEKKFKITFKNYDGTTLKYGEDKDYYELPYGAMPQWLSQNPTRPADEGYYTYDFTGWKPTPAPVTDDAVYIAQYDRKPVLYAITFEKADHTFIETTYFQRDNMPSCQRYELANNEKWSPVLAPVTGDATYTIADKGEQSDYTIIWKNWDGTTLEMDENVTGTPEYNSATPTKPILGDTKYTFAGWYPEVQTATEDKVYVALFDEADNDIEVGGTPVTINKDSVVSTVTIHNNGVLTIDNNKKLTVTNLILEADVDPVTPTNEASGQLYAANSTQVTVDYAYYDLKLNVAGHHWRAFGVPWQVNIDATPLKEVKTQDGDESDRTLVLGRDYDIVYYNGAKRASSGAGYWCWEFVENHEHVLQPGQGYMIQFVAPVGTVRFAKATGAPVIFTGTVDLDENASAIDVNNGWNAMSNPMPFHAKMTEGPTVGYVHNGEEIGNDGYVEYDLADRKFLVGKTVYVQAGVGGDNVTPVYANGDVDPIVAAAPVRRIEATEKKYMSLRDYYQVAIASTTTEGGHIYVLPEEEKENKYVIGHDLAQFGMSAAIPQIWVNRYDTKLALNTTALFNETAEFPMGVYAPTAGEYTISLNAQPSDEYNVYLTRDGQAIWNLSDGAFTADLKAGIQSNYGLRLTVNKAPQVVTGVDEAVVDAKGEIRKVMINNQVYIIRGESVYTIDGQLVK